MADSTGHERVAHLIDPRELDVIDLLVAPTAIAPGMRGRGRAAAAAHYESDVAF